MPNPFEYQPREQPVPEGYYDRDEDDYDSSGCNECGGRGYVCIHGDPPTPCRSCNPDGKEEDGYY